MGMHLVICKNEVERFDKVKENYDGNLPKILIRIPIGIETRSIYSRMKRLDYGSVGLSMTKEELLDFLLSNRDKVMSWQVDNLYELMEKVNCIEEDEFMLVHYEI